MNLFDVNRLSLLKIFETHQFKGQLTLPDFLNIATSLKIYPDLAQASDLENLFRATAAGSRLTLDEFEELVKKLALKFTSQSSKDPSKNFFNYLKTPALNSYGILLKTTKSKPKPIKPPTTSSRATIIKSHINKSLNLKLEKSSKSKNSQLTKRKSCFNLLDSKIVEYQEIPTTSRRTSSFESTSLHDSSSNLKFLKDSLKKSLKKDLKLLHPRKLKPCLTIHNLSQSLNTTARLSFLLWKHLI
jgi:hypothetical protein